MARRRVVDPLSDLVLFQGLSNDDRARIRSLMTRVDIKAGREFIKEGAPGREFFIVMEGEVSIRKDGEVVATGGPGDFFGELAVVSGQPRNASVQAETDTVLEVLNRREFSALLNESPGLTKKILVSAVKRLAEVENRPGD